MTQWRRGSLAARRARRVRVLVLALLPVCGGCATMEWVNDDLPTAQQQAREQRKYLFVYYRWWASAECGAMERDVLLHPDVTKLFQNTINCWLIWEWKPNWEAVQQFGIQEQQVPSFVIVAPDGSYRKRTGVASVPQFVQWAQQAMPTPGASTETSPQAPVQRP